MFDSLFKSKGSKGSKGSKSPKSSKKSSSKRYQEPSYPTDFTPDFTMRAGQTYGASQRFQPDFSMRHGQTYDASQPIYANTRPFAVPAPQPEPAMTFTTPGNAFFTDMSSSGPSLSRSNAIRDRSTTSRYRENSGHPTSAFILRAEAATRVHERGPLPASYYATPSSISSPTPHLSPSPRSRRSHRTGHSSSTSPTSSSSSSSRSHRQGHSSSSSRSRGSSSSRRHHASSGRQPSSNTDCDIQRWYTCREQWQRAKTLGRS
ncbi:hypothetical protein SBRCBS47491_007455 [Sporothrix bragantina]|uniref:Uncharacterized protein n=1 Tax=Sporothrix bragantina TaxID=671064 RepID=A0ABP0CDB8_9PEZI